MIDNICMRMIHSMAICEKLPFKRPVLLLEIIMTEKLLKVLLISITSYLCISLISYFRVPLVTSGALMNVNVKDEVR